MPQSKHTARNAEITESAKVTDQVVTAASGAHSGPQVRTLRSLKFEPIRAQRESTDQAGLRGIALTAAITELWT